MLNARCYAVCCYLTGAASILTKTSRPSQIEISYASMSKSWPRKSTRAECIGRVYELGIRDQHNFGNSRWIWEGTGTYSGSRPFDQKKCVI